MQKVKQFFIFLLIPAQLCWSLQAGSEAVICIEKDGHLAIENSINGACGGTENTGPYEYTHGSSSITSEDSHCDDCIDVPILQSITYPVRRTGTAIESNLLSADITAINPHRDFSISRTARHSTWPSGYIPTDPNHRKTTVLLI